METTEATTGCLTDCDLGHSRCSCAPAEYAEPSAQCISLHQPSSSACQSTITYHSLEKFAIASSTVNQSNHRNQQYSVIAVTDEAGAIVERYSYTAYGEPAFFNGSGLLLTPQSSLLFNRFTYTGREYDSTIRLYHYRARMYDSGLGRFLGRDPIGFEGSQWSLFEYCNSQTLGKTDPTGTEVIYAGPGRLDVDKNDTCCDQIDPIWAIQGYRSPADCISNCKSDFAANGLTGTGLAATICGGSTSGALRTACGILGAAAGGLGVGVDLGCTMMCLNFECTVTSAPQQGTRINHGWLPGPWDDRCEPYYFCPNEVKAPHLSHLSPPLKR